jgi:Domain of unknown function (DUF6531)
MLATGADGPVNWGYALDGEPPLPGSPAQGSDESGGAVFPGEAITLTMAMYNTSATDQQVHVYWALVCGDTTTTYDLNQMVTAPPAASAADSVQGATASFTFQVPSAGAADCSDSGPGAPSLLFLGFGQLVDSDYGYGEAFGDSAVAVPAGQAAGCPGSPDSASELSPHVLCADPVDTESGDFSDTFMDAALQGPGYPLMITRSYSSAVTTAGVMGPGWSLPWQASLSVQASGDVVLTAENGDQFDYASNGDGSFTAPAGPRSVLAAVMSGTTITGYTLTAPDNHVLAFSASGQPGDLADRCRRASGIAGLH